MEIEITNRDGQFESLCGVSIVHRYPPPINIELQ